MLEYVLKATNLSKKYNKNLVLDGVDINVKKGGIYGLVGENGAGKTTLIRIVMGLVSKNSGRISLFEGDNLNNQRKRIGALIERPAFYSDMTAYENLEVYRIQRGIPGKQCIGEVLDLLELNEVKNRKVKCFSLGMKQKLALAMVILGEPEFLILDEPINGLDPIGIVKVRNILKLINKEKNTTILVSSHILEELYQIATCYGFIHKGKLIKEITSEKLEEQCKKSLNIKVNNINKAVVIFEKVLNTKKFKILSDTNIKLFDYIDNPSKVSKALFDGGILIDQIMVDGGNLESYFIKTVGGELNG